MGGHEGNLGGAIWVVQSVEIRGHPTNTHPANNNNNKQHSESTKAQATYMSSGSAHIPFPI